MHSYGIGYGVSLAACVVGWLLTVAGAPAVGATPPWVRLGGIFLLVTFSGWLLVAVGLWQFPELGASQFRSADPRGFGPAGAGLLAGLAGVGGVLLIHPLVELLLPDVLRVQRDADLDPNRVIRWMLFPDVVVLLLTAIGGAAIYFRVSRVPRHPGSP